MQKRGRTTQAASFHSADNKALLWSALQEAGAFAGLGSGAERDVMSSIEARMLEAVAPHPGGASPPSVTTLNKQVLQEVMVDIAALKARPASASASGVQQAFARKEAEIQRMAEGERPRQMDFSDAQDGPMKGGMDRALQEAVSRRSQQADASRALHAAKIREAEKWLGREREGQGQGKVRQLRIGETLGTEAAGAIPVASGGKRVRFEVAEPEDPPGPEEAQRFLRGLKRDNDDLQPVVAALLRIESALAAIPAALREVSARFPSATEPSSPPPPPAPPSSPSAGIDGTGTVGLHADS